MNTHIERCEQAAYEGGLADGLAAALAGVDVPAAAPGRFAAVPAGTEPARAGEHGLAALEGIAFVSSPGAARPSAEAAALVAAARLGLVRRLTELAAEHLTNRTAGGEPLIRKQLVTGALADIVAATENLRRHLRTAVGYGQLADVHDQLGDLGWQVAKLFGACGYIADHPIRAVYVSALVANTWRAA